MGRRLTLARLQALLTYAPEEGIFRWKNPTSNRVKPGDVAGRVDGGYVRIRLDGTEYPHKHSTEV
jgi:hypothetical protein